MQVSPDGKYLRVAHYRRKSMFLAGGGQIVLYDLAQNGSSLTYKDTVNFDNYTKCNTFDFTTGSKYLYMSARSTSIGIGLGTPPDNIRRFNIETESWNNVISNYFGDIRRGKDTAMYVCMPGLTTVKKVTNPNYTTTVSDYTILTESHWRLTGALPLQPYRIYPKMELLYARNIGDKKYEETDHLGNVRFVFSDRKISTLIAGVPGNFRADSVSYMDYYAGGMLMPGRSFNSNTYTFGFNGKLKDDEWTGSTGSHLDFGDREYDSRICRWFTPDKLSSSYAPISPYVFSLDNPIIFKDADGNIVVGLDGKPVTYTRTSGGQVQWSSNASADVQKIGNAMIKTPSGEAAFRAMQEIPTKVHLKTSDNKLSSYYGLTKNKGGKDEQGFYKEATITVNTGLINSDNSRFITEEEGINAIGVHESWHLDPKQIAEDESGKPYFDREVQTFNSEYSAREEYQQKYMNIDLPTSVPWISNTINLAGNSWKFDYEKNKAYNGESKPPYMGLSQGSFNRTTPDNGNYSLPEEPLILGSEGY